MATKSRSCGTCTYFEPSGDDDGEGECRRHAPRPAADRRETMWVSVSDTDWCGEWDSR